MKGLRGDGMHPWARIREVRRVFSGRTGVNPTPGATAARGRAITNSRPHLVIETPAR
ncbi:MAG: hypothetical protein KF812_06130 [Fimbriimonadaceae bacterium]|nr:hypothetical protein [Fimbriimonadaceae bacterium]